MVDLIQLFLAFNFNISVFYSPFIVFTGCGLVMVLLCVPAIISLKLMAKSLGLGALRTPKMTTIPLNARISLIVASIFHISTIYGLIGFCFGYDALLGLCYHKSREN